MYSMNHRLSVFMWLHLDTTLNDALVVTCEG
jgi:hypothetical protein